MKSKTPKIVEDESVKVRILINNINSGDVGYNFEKLFKGYGKCVGCVIESRHNAQENKTRRCLYTDGHSENFSLYNLKY